MHTTPGTSAPKRFDVIGALHEAAAGASLQRFELAREHCHTLPCRCQRCVTLPQGKMSRV